VKESRPKLSSGTSAATAGCSISWQGRSYETALRYVEILEDGLVAFRVPAFVLEVDGDLWAIEVKASRHVDGKALRGFTDLDAHARHVTRRIVVFLGPRRQRLGDVEAIPLMEFLAELPD
jgi:hypothetical protein